VLNKIKYYYKYEVIPIAGKQTFKVVRFKCFISKNQEYIHSKSTVLKNVSKIDAEDYLFSIELKRKTKTK
jgi:hypothetical protein